MPPRPNSACVVRRRRGCAQPRPRLYANVGIGGEQQPEERLEVAIDLYLGEDIGPSETQLTGSEEGPAERFRGARR